MDSVLPRKPILSSFTTRLRQKVPKIIFATNPCRIKFCDQEIVVFRQDLMSKMLRNLVSIRPNVSNDELRLFVRPLSFNAMCVLIGIVAGSNSHRPEPLDAPAQFRPTSALGL